jgi:hypothetical protein
MPANENIESHLKHRVARIWAAAAARAAELEPCNRADLRAARKTSNQTDAQKVREGKAPGEGQSSRVMDIPDQESATKTPGAETPTAAEGPL